MKIRFLPIWIVRSLVSIDLKLHCLKRRDPKEENFEKCQVGFLFMDRMIIMAH